MTQDEWRKIEGWLELLKSELGVVIEEDNVKPEFVELVGEAYDICDEAIHRIRAAFAWIRHENPEGAEKIFKRVELNILRLKEILKTMIEKDESN